MLPPRAHNAKPARRESRILVCAHSSWRDVAGRDTLTRVTPRRLWHLAGCVAHLPSVRVT